MRETHASSSSSSAPGKLSNKVLTVFQQFDANGDGIIDRHELQKFMQSLDPVLWSIRRVGRLLHALDTNRDGRLQYREFVEWACSQDASQELKAFRQALHISQEEAKEAPRNWPSTAARHPSRSVSRPRSKPGCARSFASRAPSASRKQLVMRKTSGDLPARSIAVLTLAVEPLPCPETNLHLPCRSDAACRLLEAPLATAEDVAEDTRAASTKPCEENGLGERLIIFDFDATITMDKDERFKGLIGPRLSRLKDMMEKIRSSSVRCVLVTAQFPMATQEITIPSLQRTGLSGLFEDESLDSRLQLYWDDVAHGTIYNGAKVMMGKIELIVQIINGDNCWGKSFVPSNVLFIDDDVRNFRGYERAGIQIRHVNQDGMVDEDMEVVEAFAQGLDK